LKQKVNEGPYSIAVDKSTPTNDDSDYDDVSRLQKVEETLDPTNPINLPLGEAIDSIVQQSSSELFSMFYFFLVGFVHDDGYDNDDERFSSNEQKNNVASELRVSKLVRKGMGTRCWEWSIHVTHVVVNDDVCEDKDIQNTLQIISMRHPNNPIIISPFWLVSSLYTQSLSPCTEFIPSTKRHSSLRNIIQKPVEVVEDEVEDEFPAPSTANQPESQSRLFQDCIFTFVRTEHLETIDATTSKPLAIPTPNVSTRLNFQSNNKNRSMVDFFQTNEKVIQLQTQILEHSGILLTKELVQSIQKSSSKKSLKQQYQNRVCYIVMSRYCTSSNDTVDYFKCHTKNLLVAKLMTFLKQYDIRIPTIQIMPFWITSCIDDNFVSCPTNYPSLFQMDHFIQIIKQPSKLITPNSRHKRTTTDSLAMKVAITGFVGTERCGIKQLLQYMTIQYTENMRRINTHLICKSASGAKYERALEWNIKVVSLDWLLHISRFGLSAGDECNENDGGNAEKETFKLEDKFCVGTGDQTATASVVAKKQQSLDSRRSSSISLPKGQKKVKANTTGNEMNISTKKQRSPSILAPGATTLNTVKRNNNVDNSTPYLSKPADTNSQSQNSSSKQELKNSLLFLEAPLILPLDSAASSNPNLLMQLPPQKRLRQRRSLKSLHQKQQEAANVQEPQRDGKNSDSKQSSSPRQPYSLTPTPKIKKSPSIMSMMESIRSEHNSPPAQEQHHQMNRGMMKSSSKSQMTGPSQGGESQVIWYAENNM